MINAGKYIARIKDFGVGTTKAGDPKAMVMFTLKDENGTSHDMTWNGSLKEGRAREITIDALLICGLKGDDLSRLSMGVESGILDVNSDVQLDIQHESFEGKTSAKIKWVNRPGGAAFRDKLTPDLAVQKMAGLNLKADIAARRKETGLADKKKDLPF